MAMCMITFFTFNFNDKSLSQLSKKNNVQIIIERTDTNNFSQSKTTICPYLYSHVNY